MIDTELFGGNPTYTFDNKEALKFVCDHKDVLMPCITDNTGT